MFTILTPPPQKLGLLWGLLWAHTQLYVQSAVADQQTRENRQVYKSVASQVDMEGQDYLKN